MINLNTKPQINIQVEKEGKSKETKQAQCSIELPPFPYVKEESKDEKVSRS